VVTTEKIEKDAALPQTGHIAGEIIKEYPDSSGKKILSINTGMPWGIESENGQSEFDVYSDQISEREP